MCGRRLLVVSTVILPVVLAAATGAVPSAGPAAEISFSSRVLDSQGQPVAGAKVTLYQVNYGGSSGSLPQVQRVKEITTGADGAFVFTAAKESESYGQGSIIARKDGLALGWVAWQMREGPAYGGSAHGGSDIILGEPKPLSGSVVDEGDTPVIDAEVSIALAIIGSERDQRFVTSYAAPGLMTARTDSTGRFVFPNLPGEATCELLAKKPGRATVCTFDPSTYRGEKCQFSPGQAGIKLTLPAEARIEGKVLEKADGKPAGGIQLIAQPPQRGLPFTVETVTSGPDGAFSIGSLSAGDYTVQLVSPREGLAEWVAEPVKVGLKAGETVRDIAVSLTKGGLVEVIVKEDAGGKPIDKASISIRDAAAEQWLSSQTDAGGVARLRLAPGNYEFGGVYKQGYTRPAQMVETFTIAEGETKTFEQTLGGLPSVTGVVYDDNGKPLEGAAVRIVPGGGLGSEVASDAQGQFKASWEPRNWSQEGMVFYIVARHPQRNLAVAQPVEDGGSKMEVKLQPGVIITGQVVDPNGKGIEGADILMMLRAARWGATFMPYRGTKTDGQGKYEVVAIPSGQRYSINASAAGFGQAQVDLEAEEVKGDRVKAGTCTLAVANLSVSGTVVDSEGKPVRNANVSCYGDSRSGQPNREVRTDAEGKFTLTSVCPGRIRIQANAQVGGVYLNGNIETDGGAKNVQIAVAERSSGTRYVPQRPASLKGRPLPDLKKLGIELPAEAEGKVLLVCCWDMNQRPSRRLVTQLAGQAAQLGEKGVVIVAVQAADVDQNALTEWTKASQIPFIMGSIAGDAEKTRFEWGVASLPHLILTDRRHVVVAEGFGLGELEKNIEEASGR